MLYREYNPDTLYKIQTIEQMMLSDFDALCTKHGIEYFAGGGTAIGAVRHHGMIPWDDDIDLNMLPGDYEKFLSIAEKEYGEKYYVLNADNNINFSQMSMTRWCLSGTVFEEECMKGIPLKFGIFLDIYCFENIPDDDKLAKKQWHRAWLWGKLMTLRMVSRPTLYAHGLKAKILQLACLAGHFALHALFTQNFLHSKAAAWSRKYRQSKCSRVAYMFDTVPYKSVLTIDDIFPTRYVNFGTGKIRVSKNIEDYLRLRFGDYMKLPDEKNRHNHPPYKLDFGLYGNISRK